MAYFIIQTRYGSPQSAIKGWYDEPNGSFDSLAEAQAAMQSLVDVCGYDYDHMRIVEIAD
jgi:hypothetical protein